MTDLGVEPDGSGMPVVFVLPEFFSKVSLGGW